MKFLFFFSGIIEETVSLFVSETEATDDIFKSIIYNSWVFLSMVSKKQSPMSITKPRIGLIYIDNNGNGTLTETEAFFDATS